MYSRTIGLAARAEGDSGPSVGLVLHDFSTGGTERVAIRLANQWAAMGRRVTLICGSAEGPQRALVSPQVTVLEPRPAIPRGPGSRRRLGQAVADAFAASAPDVLFVPGNFHWPTIAPFLARFGPKAPPVVAQISSPLRRLDRGPLRQALFDARLRRTMRHVAAAVALSDEGAREADGVLGRRITTVLPLPALAAGLPPPCPLPPGGQTILAAGRLAPQKDFDLALRAFALLPQRTARLVILGEGPLRAELARTARRLGVADRVEMPGFVPDIRPWLDRARVFLLSSRWEGYGAVVIEALAAGRPVVSTDCTPATHELIARTGCGAVTPVGDAQALANALGAELAAPAPDVAALAAAVDGYRIEAIAQAYLAVFDRVATAPAGEGLARLMALGTRPRLAVRSPEPVPLIPA
ncbi:glycosyltransferase [Phenylobacterium sp.]|uniref:glycosyltransferase n=1 Tax=Phenylobacterium sp. TaxID=1871053 RepID=UPI0025FB48E6|nr:glycosyltransferase [Phenylobacterium sp.]